MSRYAKIPVALLMLGSLASVAAAMSYEVPIEVLSSFTVFDDPVRGEISWEFPPWSRVIIHPLDATPTGRTSWGAVKALYR